ncbi:MAG: 5'/3'-nucleotidase SurE [Rhabdochlamydiaceae bacterium]|nr:5'/3'-nucleotidase SurE [Rhabdochlamydiaceae bacterium]
MMTARKPTVLLTNDDGIRAPGLKHLWNSLKDHCDIYIFAPATEQSGVGAAVSLRAPLHVTEFPWENQTPAWQITGTPADCVRMGTSVVLQKPVDLILSGINKGANSGRNIFFSGTVGGVIDGAMRGIPGIAFSCEDYDSPNYEYFEPHIFSLVQYILDHPLELGTFLNVNFPSSYKKEHKGYRWARQGLGYYREQPQHGKHPDGGSYYWMGGQWAESLEHEESDVHLLKQGFMTVVPVQVQELTDMTAFQGRKEHFQQSLTTVTY